MGRVGAAGIAHYRYRCKNHANCRVRLYFKVLADGAGWPAGVTVKNSDTFRALI